MEVSLLGRPGSARAAAIALLAPAGLFVAEDDDDNDDDEFT